MDQKEMTELLESLGSDFEAFKKANDQRLDTLEKAGGVAEISEKVDKINDAMTELVKERDQALREVKVVQDRVDELESALNAIDLSSGKAVRKDLQEYADTFDEFMRSHAAYGKQGDPKLIAKLNELAKDIPELKAYDTSVGATGGVAVPEIISREINDQVRLISPVRDLVKFVTVGSSDYKELLNIHGENSAWVGEGGPRNETDTSLFRERAPTIGTLYAYPRATEEALQDVFFSIPNMITSTTADEFAIQEEDAMLRGNGTTRPTGIFDTAPTTDADTASPARDANAIQYVPLSTASPVSDIDPDQLLEMLYLLRRPYRMRANWTMNSPVTGAVRKIKDQQGQYLWAPGLAAGEPDRLLGFPVTTLEGMDDLTTNSFPIMFGDFQRGYLMVLRASLRITVDDNITQPGYVKWYIRERVGGILLDNNAIKAGRFANS